MLLKLFKLCTFWNEMVLLKELLVLKQSLLEELLLSPTQDCDISIFCHRLEGCGFSGNYGFKAEDSEDISSAQ